MRKSLSAALLAAPLMATLVASPATAAPEKSPGQTCKGSFQGMLLVGPPEGYFAKQGGCASTVAAGALQDPSRLASLTTRAGYIQTCQFIREFEGFPFTFGPYPFGPKDATVASIPECADVLKQIHLAAAAFGPE